MASNAYQLFRTMLQRGDLRGAIRLAEEQSVAGPRASEFWLTQLAVALTRAKRYDDALAAADRALQVRPRAPWALLARGRARWKLGRYADAITDLEEALAGDDERVRGRARQGILESLAKLGQWQRLLELAGSWFTGVPLHRWRARALSALGRREEAACEYRSCLAERPDDRDALWGLTELEIEQEGLAAVLARLRRLARIPSRPKIYREIYASLLRRAGRADDALREYERLVESRGDANAMRKQAFILAKQGREEEAITLFEELLRLDPRDYHVHSAYGAACKRAGCANHGCGFYRELIALHPQEKRLYGRIKRLTRAAPGTEPEPEAPGGQRAAIEGLDARRRANEGGE